MSLSNLGFNFRKIIVMNRKEQTEKFALNALGYVVAIMGVLFLLSMLVSCTPEDDITIPDFYTL